MLRAEEYIEIIRPKLTDARFIDSLNVAQSARELANIYGCDEEKCAVAGILHDIMKDTDKEQQLKMLSDFGIMLNTTEKVTPSLWHQISGAAYIEHILGIKDEEILGAVRYHTSGKSGMSTFEKIIFIADFISADRIYPGVDVMRRYAAESLDKAIVEGLAFTIKELAINNRPIIADTIFAYNEAVLKNIQGKE